MSKTLKTKTPAKSMAPLPVGLFVRNSEIKFQDVLLGKGGPSACHVGTVAMKVIIEARLDTYLKANLLARSGKTNVKTLITLQVVNSVQLAGGHFLAQKAQAGNPSNRQWYVMTNVEARIKVRELFREFIKNQTLKRRHPCVLLEKIGLSGLFNKNSTFGEVVSYIAASSDIQEFLIARNTTREKRQQRRSSSSASAAGITNIGKKEIDEPVTLSLSSQLLRTLDCTPANSSTTQEDEPLPLSTQNNEDSNSTDTTHNMQSEFMLKAASNILLGSQLCAPSKHLLGCFVTHHHDGSRSDWAALQTDPSTSHLCFSHSEDEKEHDLLSTTRAGSHSALCSSSITDGMDIQTFTCL